jgi:hypothetical protein
MTSQVPAIIPAGVLAKAGDIRLVPALIANAASLAERYCDVCTR